MRKITETHTGKIVSDTDLKVEYLYVGDYGKENNIKADFLGYTKRIEKVEHKPVDIADKLVVTVSSQKGCPMNCNFCDCPKFGFHGNVSTMELVSEITTGIALSGIRHGSRLNVHYARMGEPTFNQNVITSARVIAEMLADSDMDTTFDTYHPVVSTMMPKSNKNLYDFLHKWVETGFEHGGEDGFGLQFSINTLDEDQRNEMFRNKSLSHIAENSYGQEVYLSQIKDKLKLDEENEIYFPIQIKGVSISFIQGLIKDLVNTYGKEKVLQLITLKSDNEMLQERLNRNIKF